MPFTLKIEIRDLPKTPNQLLGRHWRTKQAEARKWEKYIWAYVPPYKTPAKPLENVVIHYTRHSSKQSDYDNLAASFKHVQDALVKNKIIKDDSKKYIQCFYSWKHVPRNSGYITIKIKEKGGMKG